MKASFHLGEENRENATFAPGEEEQEPRIAPQEAARPRIALRGGAEALRRPQPLGPETQCLYKTEAN